MTKAASNLAASQDYFDLDHLAIFENSYFLSESEEWYLFSPNYLYLFLKGVSWTTEIKDLFTYILKKKDSCFYLNPQSDILRNWFI